MQRMHQAITYHCWMKSHQEGQWIDVWIPWVVSSLETGFNHMQIPNKDTKI